MLRLVRFAQSNVGMMIALTMSTPPMVGVPALGWCEAGPSARICWPRFQARSRPMTHGPRTNEIRSAVMVAYTARNVMYRKTLKIEIDPRSG